MELLGQSIDNKTIAQRLNLAIKTVEKHIIQIYNKLGLTSRAEAAQWWDKNGEDVHGK